VENNAAPNNSMDVRAKQRLCFHVVLFPLACVVVVSPHVISAVRPPSCEKWKLCVSSIFAYNFRMLLPRYELKSDESLTVFEFVSVGRKGEIPKIVQYSETNLKDFYNLGFGDKDLQTGEVDDTVISDNGDSQKVLATVTATPYAFTDKYPEAWIYATGSTKSRTRLYRIGLTNNLDEITEDFELYGQREGEWQEFVKGVEYEAFLVRRRS